MKRLRKLLKSFKKLGKKNKSSQGCSLEEALEPRPLVAYEDVKWEMSGWILISKPSGPYWFMQDPIYVRMSKSLQKKLGIEHLSLKDIQFLADVDAPWGKAGADNNQLYLLQMDDKLELVRVDVIIGGLDGSGRYYTFDLPNVSSPVPKLRNIVDYFWYGD